MPLPRSSNAYEIKKPEDISYPPTFLTGPLTSVCHSFIADKREQKKSGDADDKLIYYIYRQEEIG